MTEQLDSASTDVVAVDEPPPDDAGEQAMEELFDPVHAADRKLLRSEIVQTVLMSVAFFLMIGTSLADGDPGATAVLAVAMGVVIAVFGFFIGRIAALRNAFRSEMWTACKEVAASTLGQARKIVEEVTAVVSRSNGHRREPPQL